ncbi:bifunctional 2-polyprenyl-6-hydroxyphenol methylase/3-demethylubiquinol 3-O-methyltransferase UbiG [Desulfobulbus sp.]|uniref:class I SAM-dependent methyltransferase n=1 Tax=Desulfobulbus sp. TaxID=895 RepID=UPI0027BA866C|nr:class I SAM-dependent methyltransferase [Desulfobulbus sp.]
MTSNYQQEIEQGQRFGFGANWQRFLVDLSEARILQAELSLQEYLGITSWDNLLFLDAGCGSGLFSLAARRLGAKVVSFDYDTEAVRCANFLKTRYFSDDSDWTVIEGSVLDRTFLTSLGKHDIVYSWGVLHHTGEMWQAIENVASLVRPQGKFFIAIYNDAGRTSRLWWHIKSMYVKYPFLRPVLLSYGFTRLRSGWFIRGLLAGDLLHSWKIYGDRSRGMSARHDLVDWVGGFPYEYARPEEIFMAVKKIGFSLEYLTTIGGGTGCNQFVFRKNDENAGEL